MLIEGQFQLPKPPAELLERLFDARLMASCLPGCESLEPMSDDAYRAVVAVSMAGITARFNLQVQITGRGADHVDAVTRGEEGSNASSLRATSRISLQPEGEGTLLSYRSDVSVTGRLGRFGLGVMKKKAQSMGEQFATNLRTQLQPPPQTEAAVLAFPPPVHLVWWRRWWRALWQWFRGAARPPASTN